MPGSSRGSADRRRAEPERGDYDQRRGHGTGKRQRHSEFVGLTDEELLALIEDPATPRGLRRKAVREAKFRGLRNVRKRRSP